MTDTGPADDAIKLVVFRMIIATPERVFAACTDPKQLVAWWGPKGVTCIGAEVDLRVGGRYRIGNRMPDGKEIWITGTFEVIKRPHLLTYSWQIEGMPGDAERVTVQFEERFGDETEVILTHEKISSEALRDQHAYGWMGCLDGLVEYVAAG